MRLRPVENRRPADAAEPAPVSRRRLVIGDQLFALDPVEIAPADPRAAAEHRAVLLAAQRAMTIERAQQRPGDLELDAAAQAAALDRTHLQPPPGPTSAWHVPP